MPSVTSSLSRPHTMVQCRRVALLASAVVAMALTSYAFVLMAASQQISARDAKGELSSESVQRIMQKLGSLERTSAAALAAAAPVAAGASGAPRGPERTPYSPVGSLKSVGSLGFVGSRLCSGLWFGLLSGLGGKSESWGSLG